LVSMTTILVETYKIKSIDHVSQHDKILEEWLNYIVDNAKSKGWKAPTHNTYSVQGDDLERHLLVFFDNSEHESEWLGNVRDDKFNEYNDKFMALVEDFSAKMITETWSI
jgi:hypothetical protein